MYAAAVPEASVNEHGHTLAWEHDIRVAPETGEWAHVNAESESLPVQRGSQ